MRWFKRKPKTSYADILNPISLSEMLKEESPMTEKTEEKNPFNPYDYGGSFINWLATPEEIEQLRVTKSEREYDETMGKIKHLRNVKIEAEAAREAAIAAEKAKTHWATVELYNGRRFEAEAEKLDAFMNAMNQTHSFHDLKMVPLHTFQDGVMLVRLKEIFTINFTVEYMEAREAANEDKF
jgi:hypothetical protein